MGCCAPVEVDDTDIAYTCPDCGEPVNADGQCVYDNCAYSSVICELCGDAPCDYSC